MADSIPLLSEGVPVVMPDLPAKLAVNRAEQLKAFTDPVRRKILAIIQSQPATAKQIATRLGASPGAIGHHLKVLEEAGLAQVVARRLVHGIVASYYTRTARVFVLDLPPDLAGAETKGMSIVSAAREELAEALATRQAEWRAGIQGFPHARLSPERAQAYVARIQALVDDFLSEPADPGDESEVYGLLLALFPSPGYMQPGPSGEA